MGTPDFAVKGLEAIHQAGHEIPLVISQEDKAKDRKGNILKTPVKQAAESLGLPVRSVIRLRKDAELLSHLKDLNPDCIVVAAFGQILPKEVLELPRYGCVNIHASLLPLYRGASPIQQAILNRDKETGISTMLMAEGLDTGDILLQKKLPLTGEETGESLFEALALLSQDCILETLRLLEEGKCPRRAQEEEKASHCSMILKQDGFVNWNKPAVEIEAMVRAFNPWPAAVSILSNGKSFKIWKARVVDKLEEGFCSFSEIQEELLFAHLPESLSKEKKEAFRKKEGVGLMYKNKENKRLLLSTGEGYLEILEIQVEGKKRMDTPAFLLGFGG
jgi:methionyl-tRNA formyltransferase